MKTPAFNSLQNQYRGIIASIKSTGFREIRSSDRLATQYWTSLKPLFLSARIKLRPDQYHSFLNWVDAQESTVLREIQTLPKGYEQLAGVANSKPASLTTEILWATALLSRYTAALGQFRALADDISRYVLSDKFPKALETLDHIDRTWGISLWSLQLRVGLTNEAYGLESQKKIVADARGAFDRGLLGFVAYYCGVRNESRTTAERFSTTTERRISDHPFFSKEVKIFLRHVLLGDLPSSHADLADLLRVSQSHHFIDLYEDLISVLQALCLSSTPNGLKGAATSFLKDFECVSDFRLRKLSYAFNEVRETDLQYIVPSKVLGWILADDPRKATRAFFQAARESRDPNPWDYIYMGWAASEGRLKKPKEKRIVRRCTRFIAATFMSTDLFDPHDAIIKLSRNFGQIPFFRALWSYSNIINSAGFASDLDHRYIGLNSATFGLEDLSRDHLLELAAVQTSDMVKTCAQSNLWRSFAGQEYTGADNLGIISIAKSLGKSLRGELPSSAVPVEVHRETLGARNFFRDIVTLQIAIGSYQRGSILTLFATACSSAVYSPLRYRISDATNGFGWEHYQQCREPILRSVAIRMVWERTFDAKTLSILRFSLKQLFGSQTAGVPSKLDWRQANIPHDTLVYFLNNVCTLDVLDILKALRGSRQVLEERANICMLLQEIDSVNRHSYLSELAGVQEEISFSDGQLIVDSSRIYVETPQLRQWARTNLAEDYSRYRDLAALDTENSQPFDELLTEIIRGQRDASTPFIPETEADVLLYNILVRLRDEFLTNSAFGLDFFLSKRIRHQSFIGSIRSPLELEELITNRSDEGSRYRPNYTWVNRLAILSSEPRRALLNAFEKFSEDFDREIIDAKDRFFQVRGKEKPAGLIFLPLTSNIVELTKSLAPIDSSFDAFLDTAIALLWIGLEPALAITRSFIKEDLKDNLTNGINELRAKVRDAIGNSNEFLEFDATIGKRSSEVQVKLDECAGWFTRTNLDFAERAFSLDEAVGMAQRFALSCLPGFEPRINQPEVVSDTLILAPSLVHLHDQTLIALQNAKEHSGLKNPRVTTVAHADSRTGVLSIRIESEIKANMLQKAREGAEERKKLISEGKFKFLTRKEGGSGFFKLAAVASQSSKGKLDFGITQDDMFYLEVQYSLISESGQ